MFHLIFSRHISVALAISLLLGGGWQTLSWADCRADYNQALELLDSTTEKAATNAHPNPDAFAGDFKQLVDKMQSEKCLPELMSLIQHIQSEQRKYPSPEPGSKEKPVPVVD